MSKRIDLSFCAYSASPVSPESGTDDSVESIDDGDTALRTRFAETTPPTLEDLRIGQHKVVDVVKGLEAVFGYELYASKVLESPDTKKIFLERSNITTKADIYTIYNITDGGEINTQQVRDPRAKDPLKDDMFIKFFTKFNKPPSIIVGLNYLDTPRETNVRVGGGAMHIHDHLFDLHSWTWGAIGVRGAGYTWLAVPGNDEHPLLQVGNFNTTEDHTWPVHQPETQRTITFRHPYKSPPKVVVWLRLLDSNRLVNERVIAFASDVTANGFTVHINSWGDSHLFAGGISWFAYPADTPGICSGDLQPTQGTLGVITFDKPFSQPPRRILVAINKLETDKSSDCRFKIIYEAVSERGMAVRVVTWGNSIIHTAGVAYIAME